MEWSNDKEELRDWMPIVMESRQSTDSVAATRVLRGTDIDFGALTIAYLKELQLSGAVQIRLSTEVVGIHRSYDQTWRLSLSGNRSEYSVETPFVFLGAGGGALSLLQNSV